MINFDLDKRVRIADGREGFVLCGVYRGQKTLEIQILTDDYVTVSCLEPQLKIIRRSGPTVVFGQEKHIIYPVEAMNHDRLRAAIKDGTKDLPAVEDIRGLDIFNPRQLEMAL